MTGTIQKPVTGSEHTQNIQTLKSTPLSNGVPLIYLLFKYYSILVHTNVIQIIIMSCGVKTIKK